MNIENIELLPLRLSAIDDFYYFDRRIADLFRIRQIRLNIRDKDDIITVSVRNVIVITIGDTIDIRNESTVLIE